MGKATRGVKSLLKTPREKDVKFINGVNGGWLVPLSWSSLNSDIGEAQLSGCALKNPGAKAHFATAKSLRFLSLCMEFE